MFVCTWLFLCESTTTCCKMHLPLHLPLHLRLHLRDQCLISGAVPTTVEVVVQCRCLGDDVLGKDNKNHCSTVLSSLSSKIQSAGVSTAKMEGRDRRRRGGRTTFGVLWAGEAGGHGRCGYVRCNCERPKKSHNANFQTAKWVLSVKTLSR